MLTRSDSKRHRPMALQVGAVDSSYIYSATYLTYFLYTLSLTT